jgi:O-antigen ligase
MNLRLNPASKEILPAIKDLSRVENFRVSRGNVWIEYLLLFCLFIFIFRHTIFSRGRSISNLDLVDTAAAVDIAAVGLAGLIVILNGLFGRSALWSSIGKTSALWLVLYYLFCGLSSLWSTIPVFSLYRSFEYFIMFLATVTVVIQYKDFAAAERAFCRITLATILLDMCVTIRYYGFSLSPATWHNTTYTISSGMLFCYFLGEYMAMTKAKRAEDRSRSRRLMGCGIFSLCALALGASSGSNIAVAVGCLVIFLALRRFVLLYAGLTVGLVLFLWGVGGDTIQGILFPGKSASNIENFSGRIFLWELLWRRFWEKPVAGYGFGLIGKISGGMATHSHNSFFSVIIGTGSVGLFLFAMFSARLWWAAIVRAWSRGTGTVGFVGALAAAFVNSMSLTVMADRWTTYSIVFVWLLGLFLLHMANEGNLIRVPSKKSVFAFEKFKESVRCGVPGKARSGESPKRLFPEKYTPTPA